MKTIGPTALFTLAAAVIAPVHAQTPASGKAAMKMAPASASAPVSFTKGEVVNVYAREKKVLLKHGEIANIGMGAMTMEFGLSDPKMLGSVKPGDKVRFTAGQVNGQYVVTKIEVVK